MPELAENLLKRVAGFASPARIQVACAQQSKWLANGTVEFCANGNVIVNMGNGWGKYKFELGPHPAEVTVFGVTGLICTARNSTMRVVKRDRRHDYEQIGGWRIYEEPETTIEGRAHGKQGSYHGVSDVVVEQLSSINLLL
jgi:hypothetical protein